MTTDLCQYLDWDSDFFGFRIAKVIGTQLTLDNIDLILDWCKTKEIDCLYYLGDVNDANSIKCAEDNKFRLVDIRITLERQTSIKPVGVDDNMRIVVRQSTEIDIPSLKSIAKSIYSHTRFYFDSNFPVSRANQMYETWIEKSCRGYADAVQVALLDDIPIGYIACHLREGLCGQIGLVGVSPNHQGRRVGQKLLTECFSWFAGMGREHITVATQARNFAGQRLYQRCGFITQTTQIWYHKWFTK